MMTTESPGQSTPTACWTHAANFVSFSTIRNFCGRGSSIYSSEKRIRTATRCSTACPSRITGL